MKTFIESNFDRPNCLILDFMFGVDFILAGNLLNWVKKNIASFLTSIASCIKETYVARTWINSQSYQMSLKCNSDWDYFHILYWISPKVTEYLNVSQARKVQKFLSSVPLPIGPSAATRTVLGQSELRERPGSPTEAGLWLLSFSTLRRSQPACFNYFYPQDVKYNGSEAHQQYKTSAGISDLLDWIVTLTLVNSLASSSLFSEIFLMLRSNNWYCFKDGGGCDLTERSIEWQLCWEL